MEKKEEISVAEQGGEKHHVELAGRRNVAPLDLGRGAARVPSPAPLLCALAASPPRLLFLLLSLALTAVHLVVHLLLSLVLCGWGARGVCTQRPACFQPSAAEQPEDSAEFAPLGNVAHYRTHGGALRWRGDKLEATGWHLYPPWASVATLVADLTLRYGPNASFCVAPCATCAEWLGYLPYTLPQHYADRVLGSEDRRLALAVVGAARILVVQGFLPNVDDIGLFVSGQGEAQEPGADWLQSPHLPSPWPQARAVAGLAAQVLRPTGRPPSAGVHLGAQQVIPLAARAALTAHVQRAWEEAAGAGVALPLQLCPADAAAASSTPAAQRLALSVAEGCTLEDFKLLLPQAQAQRLLGGSSALAALCAALQAVRSGSGSRGRAAPPLALPAITLVLRRTQAAGKWINFHYDSAGLTAVVPLEGLQGEAEGGQPLYALPTGTLLAPPRAFGVAVAHNGDVAHGVTRIHSGTRCGLYALVAREDAQ